MGLIGALKDLGRRYIAHGIRPECYPIFGTLLLHTLAEMKVPLNVIQKLLGHSSVMITLNVYGHVLPSMQDEAEDNMERLFGEGEEKGEVSSDA